MIFSECTCAVSEYVDDLLSFFDPHFHMLQQYYIQVSPLLVLLVWDEIGHFLRQTTPEVAPVASEAGEEGEEGEEEGN